MNKSENNKKWLNFDVISKQRVGNPKINSNRNSNYKILFLINFLSLVIIFCLNYIKNFF